MIKCTLKTKKFKFIPKTCTYVGTNCKFYSLYFGLYVTEYRYVRQYRHKKLLVKSITSHHFPKVPTGRNFSSRIVQPPVIIIILSTKKFSPRYSCFNNLYICTYFWPEAIVGLAVGQKIQVQITVPGDSYAATPQLYQHTYDRYKNVTNNTAW